MCSQQGIEGFFRADKMCRRIILMEDQSDVRNFVLDLKWFVDGRNVNLSSLLRYLGSKGTTITNYEFQFVSQFVSVRPLQQEIYLPIQYFAQHIMTINRKQIHSCVCDCLSEEIKQPDIKQIPVQIDIQKDYNESKNKKPKQKQRKIKSAIQYVKVWRGIHQRSNHKISLIQAAKSLRTSKKSLDDYFLQLRLGELYGFDFIKNINKGIGVLRSYIRQKSNKQLQKGVPKTIKSFDLVSDYQELKQQIVKKEDSGDSFDQNEKY